VGKKQKAPTRIQLPKDALRRVNLGQSFAEYDKVLTQQGVFVVTPAALAAQEPVRSKCFFVGRRGTGKTAITVYLGLRRSKYILQLHPQIFAALSTQLDLDELRDPRQRAFHSLVACFKRALVDEVLAEKIRTGQTSFNQFPATLTPERNYIEDHDFDLRTLAFVEDAFEALKNSNDKEWLKCMNKAKQIGKDADSLAACQPEYLVLIDRIDDSWDGSDAAVITLMALMHACVELAASVVSVRPMLFLRENIFERVRAIDPEFTRIETCVVSLDWTKEMLLEMVERRLQLPFNPKPAIGETWDYLFDKIGDQSSYRFVFDHCQHRPRDIITYCAFAVEAAQSARHEKVTVDDIHSAKRKFSESRFKDLGDEYSENYPQIQLVLNCFHGLATEFTVPAIGMFIQKLLSDAEIMAYCAKWLGKVAAPHLFIELLYSIGFAGIRNGDDVEFRGVGLRSASPPPLSSTSTIVIHPSYAAALDLQSKVIGDLDDIVLQKEGLLIDLPTGIDLSGYQGRLSALLDELDCIPHGQASDQEYERFVGDVVKLCFFRWLNNVDFHVRDYEGRVIRDWIASNVAEQGFWAMVRDMYNANQIIWECKNYADPEAGDFHQAAYYMNDAIGKLVVLCFRGDEIKRKHFEHIKRISGDKHGLVLMLRDKDLKVFLRQARNQKVKEDHIRQIFDTTIREIS
jgi:hypothetical protein